AAVATTTKLTATQIHEFRARGLEVQPRGTLAEVVEFASGLATDLCRLLEGEVHWVLDDAERRIGRKMPDWDALVGLHVSVKVARGLRPKLSQEELEQLERSRQQGDHRGLNRLESQRADHRTEEAQQKLPKSRPTVEWSQVRDLIKRAVVLGDPGYGKTM